MRQLLYAIAACSAACSRHGAPPSAHTAATLDGALPTGVTPAAITPATIAPTAIAPAAAAPATDASSCLPTHDGYLRLRMRGDSNLDIDWRDADMQCDGGPRPGQQGVRLTFAGPAHGGAHNLRFVFGIAAAPGARSAHNVPANVTVIFEGERKLFSTAGDGKCTIDELTEQSLPAQADRHLHRLTARGFCIAPATALAGKAGLLLSRFDFAGPVLEEDVADDSPPARP
jgi:hypothetical protein